MIDPNVKLGNIGFNPDNMDAWYLDVSRLEPDEHIYLVDWHNEGDYPAWVWLLKQRGSTFEGM